MSSESWIFISAFVEQCVAHNNKLKAKMDVWSTLAPDLPTALYEQANRSAYLGQKT